MTIFNVCLGICHGDHTFEELNNPVYELMTRELQTTSFFHSAGFLEALGAVYNRGHTSIYFPTELLNGCDAPLRVLKK